MFLVIFCKMFSITIENIKNLFGNFEIVFVCVHLYKEQMEKKLFFIIKFLNIYIYIYIYSLKISETCFLKTIFKTNQNMM